MCLRIYFHTLLPPSVNFRISWNRLFKLFCTSVCVLSAVFHLCSLCQITQLKKISEHPTLHFKNFLHYFHSWWVFLHSGSLPVYTVHFILAKVFLFFTNVGGQSLNFSFSQHCCVLHLFWYKKAQQILSLYLLPFLSVVTYRAPTWLISSENHRMGW